MYNEEIKTGFIKQYTKSINTAEVCRQTFNAMQPYEEQWGADLCTRTAGELHPALETMVGFRVKSKYMRLIILKDYVKWCIACGVPGACKGMLEIEDFGLGKIRSMTVYGPEHLQKCLDEICDPESEETTDCIYRCYFWLAFSGMREEDILETKVSDVDLTNLVVNHNGEEYVIYREAVRAFRNASTLTEFVYKHPNYPKPIIRNRVEGTQLIRGIRAIPSQYTLRSELSRRISSLMKEGKTEIKLSYYRVWISGLFYRMYIREKNGLPVNFKDAASRFMEGKDYKLDTGRNTIDAKRRQVMNDYLQDYERWKAAYH